MKEEFTSHQIGYPNGFGRNQVDTFVARHMLTDKFLQEAIYSSSPHGPRQVVILGAGFDTRAHPLGHLLAPGGTGRWFEIDLPAPQAYKEKVLKENSIKDPENLTRIPCDLIDDDNNWIVALERAGWDSTAPTVYILEGLVYYLTTEQTKHLLGSIPSVPQSRIIVTIIESSLQKIFEMYGPTIWKTNLAKLQKAHAFNMAHYRLYRDATVPFPERFGLKVVRVPWPTARNF